MNAEQLEAIRARLAVITPGEWRAESADHIRENYWAVHIVGLMYHVMNCDHSREYADFIAHAPADIRALFNALVMAEERNRQLEDENKALWRVAQFEHGCFADDMVQKAREAIRNEEADEVTGADAPGEEQHG